MIAEKQVDEILNMLPPETFLSKFVRMAAMETDAPKGFLMQAGLACLTQAVPNDYVGASTVIPVLYFLSVGPPSESRKTTSWQAAEALFRVPELQHVLMPQPGSYEAFLDRLSKVPRYLLMYPEGGTFFENTRDGYLRPLRAALTDMFDDRPPTRDTVVKNRKLKESGEQDTLPKPARVSFGAGVTPAYISENTTEADFRTGFLSRFHMLYCTRERRFLAMPSFTDMAAQLRPEFMRLAQWTSAPSYCQGETEGALAVRATYDNYLENIKKQLPTALLSVADRVTPIASRIAMLLAWDCGLAHSGPNPYRITEYQLLPAFSFALLSLWSAMELYPQLNLDKSQRDKAKVLEIIQARRGAPVSTGEITKVGKMVHNKHLNDILFTLLNEKSIEMTRGSDPMGVYYRAIDPSSASEAVPAQTSEAPSVPHNVIPIKTGFTTGVGMM